MSEEGSKGLDLFNKRNIHFLVGIGIMIGFGLIPPAAPLTAVGMRVIGVFLGTLYLWSTSDMGSASIIGLVALGLFGFEDMITVFASAAGSIIVVQTIFVMILAGAMVEEGISDHIGRFILTRKLVRGRPWALLLAICFTCFLIAIFIDSFLPIFLFWPICFGIFEDVGFSKSDKFPKIALIMVVTSSMIGFPVAPYKDSILVLLMNYRTISGDPSIVNNGMYFITFLLLGILFISVLTLVGKFVFRPNVAPIKDLDPAKLAEKNPLVPLDTRQKVLSAMFVVYALWMLIPSWFPTVPGLDFLSENALAWATVFVGVLSIVRLGGRPILPLTATVKKQVNWGVVVLIAAVVKLGSSLSNEQVGLSAWLSQVFTPLFQNMSFVAFAAFMLLLLCALTNVSNSLVVGMVTQPIILVFAQVSGANVAPIVALGAFFVLSSAMLTPAASPFAAVMFSASEGWLKSSDIVRYAGTFVVVEFVLLLVIGLPFASLTL